MQNIIYIFFSLDSIETKQKKKNVVTMHELGKNVTSKILILSPNYYLTRWLLHGFSFFREASRRGNHDLVLIFEITKSRAFEKLLSCALVKYISLEQGPLEISHWIKPNTRMYNQHGSIMIITNIVNSQSC